VGGGAVETQGLAGSAKGIRPSSVVLISGGWLPARLAKWAQARQYHLKVRILARLRRKFFLKMVQGLFSRGILARPGSLDAVLCSENLPTMVHLRDSCGLSGRQSNNLVLEDAVLIG
jgi:hypothetical protein